jgi:hypothetical protein
MVNFGLFRFMFFDKRPLKRVLFSASLWVGVAMLTCSCRFFGGAHEGSTGSIHNGVSADDKFPAVVRVGGCTGTFVSDTTLIYAAHCLKASGNRAIVRSPFIAETSNTFMHPSYNGIGANDIAVAIFADGTAGNFRSFYRGSRSRGTEIHMVGWGCDSTDPKRGKKEGRNRLDSSRGGVLISSSRQTNWGQKGSDVSVCPGDSGGPLFINDKLAGVTSFHRYGRGSGHPDLQYASNMSFLKRMIDEQGAKIVGFAADQDNEQDPPNSGKIFTDLLETSLQGPHQIYLRASVPADTETVVLCQDRETCESSFDGDLLSDISSAGRNIKLFRMQFPLALNMDAVYTLVALGDSGTKIAQKKFKFAEK